MPKSSTITCTRRIQFCSGHRVYGHESKCANLHGHNYVLFATARAKRSKNGLDSLGRVVDFSEIKAVLGGWIDEFWDHGFIAYAKDEDVIEFIKGLGTKLYTMPENPTAENMGRHLLERICPRIFSAYPIEIVSIRLDETENCSADVTA